MHRSDACVVTLLEATPLAHSMLIDGRVALAPGAPAVWFTFAGAWHDVGRFHDGAGLFTGCYANVLTPVEGITGLAWRTTDLFLDVWLPADGGVAKLLDAEELDTAAAAGLEPEWVRRARAEATSLLQRAAAGTWPPPIVAAWTLERARATLRSGT